VIERLRVGIGDDEVDALDVALDHVGDGVAAGAADADHADPRAKLVHFRTDEIDAHALVSPVPAPYARSSKPFCTMRFCGASKKLTSSQFFLQY
jgi:hypothetical protein